MPFKVVSQKGWVKGIVASMDRFSVPKGAILKASNFLLSDRGGLTVCDGTALQSYLPGTAASIMELGSFASPTFGLIKLAAVCPGGTAMYVYSWVGNGDALAFLTTLPMTNGWIMPQFIEFGGATIISLGNQVTPYQYVGGGGFSVLTTTNGTASGAATWQANHYYSVGDRIVEQDGNLKDATWQVVNVTVNNASGQMSNTGPIGGVGGLSGSTEPNFASTGGPGVGSGETLADNQVIWMLIKENADLGKEAVPAGAAHIISHSAALWAWNTAPQTQQANGTIDGPSVIRQSGINNPNSWPLANAAFVGRDDGTQGMGIATFTIAEAGIAPTGSLVLFKDYSTYTVNGTFGIQNFTITAVKTDMGCVAPRSVQFATGFGVIRFSHLGFSLYDGVNDRLVSEEIRPYIFGRADITGIDFTNLAWARSSLTANPPMYACSMPTRDGLYTRVFCYDLVMRAWMIVDFNNGQSNYPVTAMRQLRTPLGLGPNEGVHTYIAVFNRVTSTAEILQWMQGDPAWYDVGAINWTFTPPEVGDPASRAYFRRCNVRLAAPQPGTLTGAFNVGNEALPNNLQPEEGAGPSSGTPPNVATQASYQGDQDLGVALDVAQTGPSMNGTFSGSGPATIEGVDWHIMPKNPRPFGQRW